MTRYLMEISLKPEAFAALVQEPGDRLKANRLVFERMGASLDEYWFGVGENRVYVVAQIPDPIKVEALTMAVIAGGAVERVRSRAILTSAEALDAMRMAADSGYTPPQADYSRR